MCAACLANAQQPQGVNIGSSCNVAGGVGFVFGSSKALNCIFTRTNGLGEHYRARSSASESTLATRRTQIVWLVFAPGNITSGSLAGSYGGVTVQGTVGVGAGANILVGGSNKQITLQPVGVEGSAGLNVAGGGAEFR
jgi:hypothetical protein